MTTPQRILLVSASAGAGHTRAAQALVAQFRQDAPAADIQHWDLLQYSTWFFRTLCTKGYLGVVDRAPGLFSYLYRITDRPERRQARLIEKWNCRRFVKAALKFNPDIIVCTHFTPAAILSGLVAAGRLSVKPAIVVTDLDCHAWWLAEHYDQYFVALDETKAYMERHGIAPDRITVSGIPIDPVFRIQRDKVATRTALGLDPNLATILVSGGGFGVGPIELLASELLRLEHPAQIVLIAGRSVELKARLDRLAAKVPAAGHVKLVPIGFTTQMDEYMAAADILLSKPGGLTTSEAMARGLPMCIINPIPGQEERNADHLLESGVAIKCNNLSSLAWKLTTLLANPSRLQSLRDNATAFGRPLAAQTIVNCLLAPARP